MTIASITKEGNPTIKTVVDTDNCKLYQGHALDILRQLPSGIVDCCITSPPYFNQRPDPSPPIVWDSGAHAQQCNHEFVEREYKLHAGRGDAQKSAKFSEQASIPDTPMVDATCAKCGAIKCKLGLEPTVSMYVDHLMLIFNEVHRILRPGGTCFIVIGDKFAGSGGSGGDYNSGGIRESQPKMGRSTPYGIPTKSLCLVPQRLMIEMVDKTGWIIRGIPIWHKKNSMPENIKDRFAIDYESIIFATKNKNYYFKTQFEELRTSGKILDNYQLTGEGPKIGGNKAPGYEKATYSGKSWKPNSEGKRIRRSVWSINTQGTTDKHFSAYPETLVKLLIDAGCPEQVCTRCGTPYIRLDQQQGAGFYNCNCETLPQAGSCIDPFLGRGTTGIVAMRLARRFIGCELNHEYMDIAKKNLQPFFEQKQFN